VSEGSAALLPGWRGRRRDGGGGNTPVCFRKMIFSGKRRFGFVSVHSGVLGGERNPVARVSLPSSHSEESRRLSSSVSMKILNGRDASWVRAEPDLSTPPAPRLVFGNVAVCTSASSAPPASDSIWGDVTQGDGNGKRVLSPRYHTRTQTPAPKEPQGGGGWLGNRKWAVKFIARVWN